MQIQIQIHIQIQIPNLGSPAEFSHSHKHCKRKAAQQHLQQKVKYKENIKTITGKKRSNNKNLKSQSPVKMLMVYGPKLTTKTPPMLTTLSADALVGSMSVLGHTWKSIFDKSVRVAKCHRYGRYICVKKLTFCNSESSLLFQQD